LAAGARVVVVLVVVVLVVGLSVVVGLVFRRQC
jgi:hypothetical protein